MHLGRRFGTKLGGVLVKKRRVFRKEKVEAGSRPAAAAAAAAAGVEECNIFPFLSRDSEVTLGIFAVHFGRRFGTKLGGVLLFRKRLSGAHFAPVFLWLRR